MARSFPWRRDVSEACNWHQTQALEATIYLLRQTGPTGFLLKEEGESKTVKVFLGDPHTCTCPVFKRERDLCKHICWLLLKKFKLSQNDPLSWQLGLVEREVNEILQGRNTADRNHRSKTQKKTTDESGDDKNFVPQREIAEDDVCPICQEELLSKKLPVTYCKFSCGNTIHLKCMTVWAEHQQKSSRDSNIKCPMCREDFGPIELLKTESRNAGVKKSAPGIRLDRHLGVACSHCSRAPIEGKCYRCTVCPSFHMCQRCFNLPVHTTHSFQFRQKRNQRWRAAVRSLGASLPQSLVNDLMNREISEDDYDTLLQLDRNSQEELSSLTEESLQHLPLERVRERSSLLSPGSQCRVCLRGFSLGQILRKLPCGHKFHRECIDGWLLHAHPTCPIDGLFVLQHLDNSRSVPSSVPDRDSQDSTGTREASQLLISATGIPYASNRNRVSSGGGGSGVRNPRRPPPCLPLMNGSAPSSGGLELSGARLGASDAASSGLSSEGSRSRPPVPRHIHGVNRHRPTVSDEQALTPGDLIHFLQGVAVQHAESEGQAFLQASRRPSVGSDSSASAGTQGNESAFINKRNTLRRRPSSLERTVPSIQAITSTMRGLYLGNDPGNQPAVNEDRSIGVPPSVRQAARSLRIPVPRRRPQGFLRELAVHTSSNNNAGLQLEGSAIDVAQDENECIN